MTYNPKPTQRNGSRNIFCPYYGECLDHAAKRHWDAWACFDCGHKMMKESGRQGPFLSGDTSPYYTVSGDVYRIVG